MAPQQRASGRRPRGVLLALLAACAAGSDEDVPRPDFEYATELTSESFRELVEEVANNSAPGRPPAYFPMVMFHVSWCKHCRHALPEYEDAAKAVDEARRKGQLANLPTVPKLFLIECDTGDGKEICARHTKDNFPVIKLFRDNREVRFNRPRRAKVFAWWSMHASRPMVTSVQSAAHLSQAGQHNTVFILKVDPNKRPELLEAWHDVAFDFLEEHHFYVAPPESEAGELLVGAAPLVTARGQGLEPLPFHGEMTRSSLAAWVNVNRFPPVTEVSDWTVADLLGCGLPVVAYVHSGTAEARGPLAEFARAARDLRITGKYVFATVNVSDADTAAYMRRKYPLVVVPPRIFVLQGDARYWEDPGLVEPRSLTQDRLASLMANAEAAHDGSWFSMFKEKRKLVARLATGSLLGAVVVVMVPSLAASCCWLCARELFRNDSDGDEVIKKED